MGAVTREFVLGVDLDGVCADFYGTLRVLAAEWLGKQLDDLPTEVSYGLPEWGLQEGDYERLHRWAVTKRSLFRVVTPITGAGPTLRRLSAEGIRIRIITHRLFIPHFHASAITQTVEWLDWHGIPYWDLCLMKAKDAVGADLYVEDSPSNVERLRAAGNQVIVFTNSTNRLMVGPRADTWDEVEALVVGAARRSGNPPGESPDSGPAPEL